MYELKGMCARGREELHGHVSCTHGSDKNRCQLATK